MLGDGRRNQFVKWPASLAARASRSSSSSRARMNAVSA
jgi:hypothetical protein